MTQHQPEPSASQQNNASAPSSAPTQPVASTTLQDHIAAVTSSPSLTQISMSTPFLSLISASAQQLDGSFDLPLLSEAESHPELPASATAPSPLGAGVREQPQEAPAPSAAPPAKGQAAMPETTHSPVPLQLQQQQQLAPGSSPLPPVQTQCRNHNLKYHSSRQQPPQQQQQTAQGNGVPRLLSDLVVPFENVKQKAVQLPPGTAAHRMVNLDQVHKLLDEGYSNIPQPWDTEK
ncbi:hypothetical protein V8E52_009285 [Russula decolorans]